jgi:hypothetical protein
MTEPEDYIDRQDYIYRDSTFTDKEWYRKLYGGTWRLVKFGKDTPNIGMFIHWTKVDPKNYHGYTKVLSEETYPPTGADTKTKIFIELLRQLIN